MGFLFVSKSTLFVGLKTLALCALFSTICRSEEKDEARAYFLEGVALFSQEEYEGAEVAFEKSYRMVQKTSAFPPALSAIGP